MGKNVTKDVEQWESRGGEHLIRGKKRKTNQPSEELEKKGLV